MSCLTFKSKGQGCSENANRVIMQTIGCVKLIFIIQSMSDVKVHFVHFDMHTDIINHPRQNVI